MVRIIDIPIGNPGAPSNRNAISPDRGTIHYIRNLKSPGVTLSVFNRAFSSMCGGSWFEIKEITSGLTQLFFNSGRIPVEGGWSPRATGWDYMEHDRKGILLITLDVTPASVPFCTELIENSLAGMMEYGELGEEITTSVKPFSFSRGMSTTYAWLVHRRYDSRHDHMQGDAEYVCYHGGEQHLSREAYCHTHGNYCDQQGGFEDDDGLSKKRKTTYSKSQFDLSNRPVYSSVMQGDPFLTYFNYVDARSSRGGNLEGSILYMILKNLTVAPFCGISSNLGATGYKTVGVMAWLWRNRHLLQSYGLGLYTPRTLACNPREHYHYIDSMVIVPRNIGLAKKQYAKLSAIYGDASHA